MTKTTEQPPHSEKSSATPRVSLGVRFVDIDENNAGQRLDNFLLTLLKGVPKTRIYRIIRKGEVRVNGGRAKPDTRLGSGDKVRIPPVSQGEERVAAVPNEAMRHQISDAIIFESNELLIVNKPCGLAVHGGSGVALGVIEALRVIRPEAKFLELVHRLDRDTSGLLMIAKKRSMLRFLHEQLRLGGIQKVYHALVDGRWPRHRRLVDAPLQKNELKSGERIVVVSADGKPSTTEFAILRHYQGYTLVEAQPITGRTHQIRVHAAFAGHAIAGDAKYSSGDQQKAFKTVGGSRLMLHAAELKLTLPGESKLSVFHAPYADSFKQILSKLEVSADNGVPKADGERP